MRLPLRVTSRTIGQHLNQIRRDGMRRTLPRNIRVFALSHGVFRVVVRRYKLPKIGAQLSGRADLSRGGVENSYRDNYDRYAPFDQHGNFQMNIIWYLFILFTTILVIYTCQPYCCSRANEILSAHELISSVKLTYRAERDQVNTNFKHVFKVAVDLAKSVGTDPSMPRIAAVQVHRANAKSGIPED